MPPPKVDPNNPVNARIAEIDSSTAQPESRKKTVVNPLTIDNIVRGIMSRNTGFDFSNLMPSGAITMWGGRSAPGGFLLCDGTSYERNQYPDLFNAVSTPAVCTMTIASPCVVTAVAHGILTGDAISFETSGALPTGLTAGTTYYAIYVSADTLNVATSYANALAGTALNTSGTQSGGHTLRYNPFGVADLTHFNVPDMRSKFPIGRNSADANVDLINHGGGEATHALTIAEMPAHTHTIPKGTGSISVSANIAPIATFSVNQDTSSTGSGEAHNNLPPYLALNFIIKT